MKRKQFAALGAVAAVGIATGTTFALATSSNAATTALSSNWYVSAPYLFVNDTATPDPGTVMDATGQKAFELAFILDAGGCTPSWNGTDNVSGDTSVGNLINEIRGKGGDVSVSIGGYGGTKLGQDCGTPAATAAAYQQVVSKYSIHAMDFDLEEPEYENSTAIANELGAAQILQRNNPGLIVTVTMPGTTSGTGWFGTQLLDESKSLGFTPASFSIMPFDGGFNGGSSQTAALDAFHSLLETHMGWDSATAYAHEGISMMNGRSDTGEYFYQSDFQTVLSYVENNHLGRYTFWDVNRDRQCSPPDNNGATSSSCSSVPQASWDFTKYTTQFAGATPPTTVPSSTPSSSPTGGTGGGTCSAPAWVSTTAYNGGAVVSYNGHQWTAKWWTQGDIPGNNSQNVWTDNGACSGSGGNPSPSASSTTGGGTCSAPAWVSTTAYNGGAVVSYNGHQWTAKWWTQGDIPGNNSQNVWTDNGAC